ncbi:PTS sugar transporter subunit IIB [Virgibacillus dakarensis]|uniref:PTS sugar transporter subunit IIB n=1 Tax=Virgibacillus dakarensis TaxID=1917889 RepID=UPI000B44859F|nr:PTS sugar transporter subunit IIB [Virgibacillus dakarensis]MTW86679.1 PTS sugar transporter subunit IIB [Virgibacillus dakarensis]
MKIILLCALGMSTSLLVEKMKKAAIDKDMEVEIEALSIDSFDEQLETADVILLGPQIRYKKNTFFPKAEAARKPIDIIDMKAYGIGDGGRVLDQAMALMDNDS